MRGGRDREAPATVRLNWQLYRLCLVPVLAALVLAAFSLGGQGKPMTSTLSPESFDGARAFRLLHRMAAIAPERSIGGRGDVKLFDYLLRSLQAFGGTSRGGYMLTIDRAARETTSGLREPAALVATRPGVSSQSPIVLIAHRDSVKRGALAQLSGTAALLELASVLSNAETQHAIALVFTDGGSSGASGIEEVLANRVSGNVDAAIALGDLAGSSLRRPLVQPFSSSYGSAPEALQATVSAALKEQLKVDPGSPGFLSQLVHLAFPLTTGEQGPLNAAGVPAVSVRLAGEAGSSPGEGVSEQRLQSSGRAMVQALYSLDKGGEVSKAKTAGLLIMGRTVPEWSLQLLIFTLLLGPLLVSLDAAIRMTRRGHRTVAWTWFSLSCGLPFLVCAIALKASAAIGILHAPSELAPPLSLSFGVGPIVGLLLAASALALSWRLWPGISGRFAQEGIPSSGVAGVVTHALACLLALLLWALNPYAALIAVPALHAWLLLVSPRHRPPGRGARLAIAIAPLFTVGLIVLFYSLTLRLGPGETLLSGALLVAGGHIGWGGTLLWSIGLGLVVAISLSSLLGEGEVAERVRLPFEGRVPVLYPGEEPVYPRPPAAVRMRR